MREGECKSSFTAISNKLIRKFIKFKIGWVGTTFFHLHRPVFVALFLVLFIIVFIIIFLFMFRCLIV